MLRFWRPVTVEVDPGLKPPLLSHGPSLRPGYRSRDHHESWLLEISLSSKQNILNWKDTGKQNRTEITKFRESLSAGIAVLLR